MPAAQIELQFVRWRNFLSTGKTWTHVALNEHAATLIIGINGSGKSTIMDAISYGLYGIPFRLPLSVDELINTVNKRDMLVEVGLRGPDGNRYMVRRGRKPGILEFYCNDVLVPVLDTKKDYQAWFTGQVLKVNHSTFVRKAIIGNANNKPFMQLVVPERRKYLNDLLDLQAFDHMRKLLVDEKRRRKEAESENEQAIALNERTIELNEQHNAATRASSDAEVQTKQKELKALTKENASLNAQIQMLNDENLDLAGVLEQREELQTKERELLALQTKLVTKKTAEEETHAFFNDNNNCPTCTQMIAAGLKKEKLHECTSRISDIEGNIQRVQEAIKKLSDRYQIYVEASKTRTENDAKISSMLAMLRKNETAMKGMIRDIETIRKRGKDIKDTSEAKKKRKELEAKTKELFELKEIHEATDGILSDGGAKALIQKQYLPLFNKKVNEYLEILELFCRFEMDEKFENGSIIARHRDNSSYESLSMGERMRIDMALLFAWRDIAAARVSSSTNLLILDEVMDSSMDADGIERFFKILSRFENQNIIVITHRPDLINSSKFDRTLQFEKRKNFSTMKDIS